MQHFKEHLFCKTHTHGCFWTFLKPQNKWYNDANIGISVVNLHLPWRKLLEKELDFHLIGIHEDHVKEGCRKNWFRVIEKEKQYSLFLRCFWTFHLDLKTEFEEILIDTKYTAGIEVETTLLKTTSHPQHFKQTWDETIHLLRFEKSFLFLDYGIFRVGFLSTSLSWSWKFPKENYI